MAKVVMYSTPWCPYCVRARSLLKKKGADFTDIDVSSQPQLRKEMEQRSGRYTVPQIWIGDLHIGGSDDLHALDRAGKLDGLLAQS
ncbi:MAG TPA: glutaredoxin 3 [Dongiaceae bacterium]|nr:glutaredoxin 3 [Dongiaceae bacterium]